MPTLIVSHNKTLSTQLYREFKGFFPNNAVEYFVSHYDYYQPEAYVASRDLYIEKDASINDEIERMSLSAARSMMEREDVIIVATVSCIYGMVTPDVYKKMTATFSKGKNTCRRSNEFGNRETACKLGMVGRKTSCLIINHGITADSISLH